MELELEPELEPERTASEKTVVQPSRRPVAAGRVEPDFRHLAAPEPLDVRS